MIDFTPLNEAVTSAFGATYTYTPTGGAAVEITAIRSSGEPIDPAFHAGLWFTSGQLAGEPLKGDLIAVPSGREIPMGTYRVAEVHRDDEAGRRVMLQWVRP